MSQCLSAPARVWSDSKLLSLLQVYLVVFVDTLGVSILIPVLPFLVGAQPHADAFTSESMGGLLPGVAVSIILFSFNGALFFSTLVFGRLSDCFGRKYMLVASMMGSVAGYALQGIAIAFGSFWMLVGARVFTGLFGGSRPVAIAYIADATLPEERPRFLAMLALAVTLALQIGPLLGGSLGLLHLPLPCYAAAGVSAAGLLIVSKFLLDVRKKGSLGSDPNCTSPSEANADRFAFGINTIFSFTAGFWIMTCLLSFSLLMPVKFGFDPNQIGLASMGDGLMVLFGSPLYLMLIRRIRIPAVASIGCVLMALVAICPYLDLVPLLVVRYVAVIGSLMAVPAASAIVSLIAPPHLRGSWSGVTVAAQAAGRTISPLVMGVAFDADYHLPFLIGSGVIGAGMLLCVLLLQRVAPPKNQLAQSSKTGRADAAGEYDLEALDVEPHVLDGRCIPSERKQGEALVMRLRDHQKAIMQILATMECGEPDPDWNAPCPLEQQKTAQTELSAWLTELLHKNGYNRWPENLCNLKLMLLNSLPPLRHGSRAEKFEDLIQAFEGHICMTESSTLFQGSEDLVQTFL